MKTVRITPETGLPYCSGFNGDMNDAAENWLGRRFEQWCPYKDREFMGPLIIKVEILSDEDGSVTDSRELAKKN
jgi:hypothetical protein